MKFNNPIIKPSGRCYWKDGTDITIHTDNVPKDFYDKMNEAMYATKGKANNNLGLELVVAGVPTELIKQVMEVVENNKYYYDICSDGRFIKDSSSKMFCSNDRQKKKRRSGKYVKEKILYKDTLIGRRLRAMFGEELLTQKFEYTTNMTGDGVFAIYNDHCPIQSGLGRTMFANSSAIPLCLYFSKFDDEKKKAILANKTLATLLLERAYNEHIPYSLHEECISEKTFVKTQVELYLEELYSLTQIEGGLMPLNITKNSITADRYNTLSEVGFACYQIKDIKMWVLLLAAITNLEKVGLTIYHTSTGRNIATGNTRRGYKRLLQKVNKSYTEYSKLLRKGFTPEIARTAVLEQLKFWVSDWKNTDGKWNICKIKDWQGQETDKQVETKPKTKTKTETKTKLATMEDINKVLSK
jgi:hypothetical protein